MRGYTALALLALLNASGAHADKGDSSIRLEYQYIKTGAFDSEVGDINIGRTDAHTYMFSGHYALTDRWTVFASLPYIRKRHTGAFPHNPVVDFVTFQPPDLRITDDGDYHGGLQDLYVGMQYLALDGPLAIAPYASYGTPVRDYPFYAHAAIGRNIWHLPVGVAFGYTPYFSDFTFSGDVAYVFTQKTLGVDTSHWLINARASYFLTPRFAPKVFVSIKQGSNGLNWPSSFNLPEDFDSAAFYYHDRTIKHNFVNAGVGFDFIVNDKYQVSGTWFRMVDPDQVNIVDLAFTLGVTRFFGAEHD